MDSQQRAIRIQVIGQNGRDRRSPLNQARFGWVARAAALAFLIVLGLPILLLVVAAILVAALVFGVLALADVLLRSIRGPRPAEDGRENVRIRRSSHDRAPPRTPRAGDG